MRATDFVDAIGVNTHIAWSGPWAEFGTVKAELAYLGIAHIRDSVLSASTLAKYYWLAETGIRFDIIVSGPAVDIDADLAKIGRLQALAKGSVAAVEGVNEFNVNHAMFERRDSFGDYPWGLMLDEALSKSLRADAALDGVLVVASSLANAGAREIAAQGDLSPWVDASNWHAYFSHGDQPSRNIQSAASSARATAPGKAVFLTEAGYYTAVDAMDWGGGGVDESTQAKMTLNLLLDAAKAGVARTYLYALMDNVPHPASDDLEGSFGLFRADGHPKRAATAIHNLIEVLADKGRAAATFAVASLPCALHGAGADDRSLLLARSDGSYDLVLWNETRIWDESRKRSIPLPAHIVRVELDEVARSQIIDPFVGRTAAGKAATGTMVEVQLGDHPMVVAITPLRRTAGPRDARR